MILPRGENRRLGLYTGLNLIAITVLALVAVEMSPLPRWSVADYGAPLGLFLLFALLPAGAVGLWLTRRSLAREAGGGYRFYYRVSQVFLLSVWLLSCLPVGFIVIVIEPWPLSLRQGPDTAFARAGFAARLAGEPPAWVRGIYYRQEPGWGDSVHYLMFSYDEEERIVELASRLGLERPPDVRALNGLIFGGPNWWPSVALTERDLAFADGLGPGRRRILWLDRTAKRAYYQEFNP